MQVTSLTSRGTSMSINVGLGQASPQPVCFHASYCWAAFLRVRDYMQVQEGEIQKAAPVCNKNHALPVTLSQLCIRYVGIFNVYYSQEVPESPATRQGQTLGMSSRLGHKEARPHARRSHQLGLRCVFNSGSLISSRKNVPSTPNP